MTEETVRRTVLSPDREVCTIKIENAHAYHPYQVLTLIEGARDHISHHRTKAAALLDHDRRVDAMTRQSGEGRSMPTSASTRQRARERRRRER